MAEKQALRPGVKMSRTIMVTEGLTVPEISPVFSGLADMPPVFATAYLVAFIEWVCLEAVRPYLDDGERTVGTGMDLRHMAATPVGMKATVDVEVTAVNGRMLEYSFTCSDEAEMIGKGTHTRAIIDLEKFMSRVARKSADQSR